MSDYHSYSPADGHGLSHNPFKALISPRPIGWISSVDAAGAVNLAPYSFFNAFAETPPIIGFSSSGWKDSVSNIEQTGAFVHNIVTRDLAEKMNVTGTRFEHGVNEMQEAGLPALPSDLVAPPRVADAVASMECKLISITELADAGGTATGNMLALGEVVRIHIRRDMLTADQLVDEQALRLIARMGYFTYGEIDNLFSMRRK